MREALDSGKVAWFAADVVSTEPIKEDNALLGAANVLITPHIAWAPLAARSRLMDVTFRNVEAYINGEPINVVNL
jgi:glycerate dehydrogenase